MKFFGRNSQVVINGKTYKGNNIVFNNGSVIIDGKVQDEIDENKIEISVLCNVDKIYSEESVNIKGNVTGNVEAKTNVNCDDIYGDVNAGVNINCDDIKGNATARVTINCDDIGGNAIASKINR